MFFNQNWFINEYARKEKAKMSKSRSFLVKYRRTYVLNKILKDGHGHQVQQQKMNFKKQSRFFG